MALTNNNLKIIKAIAKNDIHTARTAALASLAEDTSKKNADVVNYYKKLLTGNSSVLMSNLPTDLQTILVGESPENFDIERYYVRKQDQSVVDTIIKMKLISDEMANRRIPYKNTSLLYGESGTGKTELGKYIAYKLNLPFFYISFVSTIDSYMGSTAKNIHKVFSFCNSIPCVLMLDEVDCVAARRCSNGSKGADGELERTTISLMQELDRLPNHVTLIAATNRLDMIDEAMLRRFSIQHEIKNMSSSDLNNMIHQYLKATNTEMYVEETIINNLSAQCKNPGQVMPMLIRTIGEGLFEEKKDLFLKDLDKKDTISNLWQVTYLWKMNIVAETEEDAISFARRERTGYKNNSAIEEYSAVNADFIGPAK